MANKFVSVLKSIGQIGAQVAGTIYPAVGPLLSMLYPKAGKVLGNAMIDINEVTKLVIAAEAVRPSQGAANKDAIVPLVAQMLRTSEIVSGHEIADDAMLIEAAGLYVEAAVKTINALKRKS